MFHGSIRETRGFILVRHAHRGPGFRLIVHITGELVTFQRFPPNHFPNCLRGIIIQGQNNPSRSLCVRSGKPSLHIILEIIQIRTAQPDLWHQRPHTILVRGSHGPE